MLIGLHTSRFLKFNTIQMRDNKFKISSLWTLRLFRWMMAQTEIHFREFKVESIDRYFDLFPQKLKKYTMNVVFN